MRERERSEERRGEERRESTLERWKNGEMESMGRGKRREGGGEEMKEKERRRQKRIKGVNKLWLSPQKEILSSKELGKCPVLWICYC